MNIKWAIHDHDKTWVENSSEDINILEDIEDKDGYEHTYVIHGNLDNPDLIRKNDGIYTWKPAELTRMHKTYFVSKWTRI